jgi:methanogenic corrinoid protein MtbC1
MLASAPGSQHVLGLSIVCEFFRTAGWQVALEVSPGDAGLCDAVRQEWFDVAGLSVALDSQLVALPALVAGLRHASRNPDLQVMLGGPAFLPDGLVAASFGAQAICRDAGGVIATATGLVHR